MKNKSVIVTVVAVLLMGLLVSFTAKAAAPAEPYKIGSTLSLTGLGSYLGQQDRDAINLVIEETNKKGGINGHPIELIVYDDGGEATKAVLNTKKLITEDKVHVLIGPALSGLAMAMIDTVQKAEIPLMAVVSTDEIVIPPRKWVFKSTTLAKTQATHMLDYAKEKGWGSKAALLTELTGVGITGEKLTSELAPQFGVKFLAKESYKPGDIDMRAQLSNIKASGAQGIINWSYNPAHAQVIKQMRELGMPVNIINQGGADPRETIRLIGDAANGSADNALKLDLPPERLLMDDDPQKATLVPFYKSFVAKYGKEPGTLNACAFDGISIVLKALEKGGADRAKIRDAMESVEFAGASGLYRFTPEDHSGLVDTGAYIVVEIREGKVYPYKTHVIVPVGGVYKYPWKYYNGWPR